ncbi:hypothetical protein Tco_1262256 [Tanacetum coccineum]
MTAVESSQAEIRSEISFLRKDTSDIKSMMTEIYQSFKDKERPLSLMINLKDQRKLVHASKEMRPDSDAPILEDDEEIGLDPKNIISAKAGEKFKKAQDAEH